MNNEINIEYYIQDIYTELKKLELLFCLFIYIDYINTGAWVIPKELR